MTSSLIHPYNVPSFPSPLNVASQTCFQPPARYYPMMPPPHAFHPDPNILAFRQAHLANPEYVQPSVSKLYQNDIAIVRPERKSETIASDDCRRSDSSVSDLRMKAKEYEAAVGMQYVSYPHLYWNSPYLFHHR